MRVRRHIPPLGEWRAPAWLDGNRALRWTLYVGSAALVGYLIAFFILFPAPILRGQQVVPRVLGATLADAQRQLTALHLQVQDGGSETHATAPAGTVIWQDPPPGVTAPEGLKVTLVSSSGPSKVQVPDVSSLDATLAQQLVTAAGLVVSQVESVQVPRTPPGVAAMTRPAAGALLAPGAGLILVVSRGEATIPVPDLLNMSIADARARLEESGLALGSVTRRRTADANPGTVVEQKPAAGTLAPAGAVIDIVVARSPQQ
ncbi:MAG TPA: PASTA domain-containing protein [Gemmatimonadales bacterium]